MAESKTAGTNDFAETADVSKVGSTAFAVNALRAVAGGFVPDFSDTSEKGRQFLGALSKHRETEAPLFYDAFSPLFFNEYSWDLFQGLLDKDVDDNCLIMGLRTMFVDGQVKEAISKGTTQIVYLGAGLDARAVRLHTPGVKTFEVDTKPGLSYKTAKLAAAGYRPYPARLVVGDYLKMDLFGELERAGLDLAAETLFVWEGNSMYIPTEATASLLRELFAKVPGATVVFDSIAARAAGKEDVEKALQGWYDVMNGGEVMFPGRMDPAHFAGEVGAELLQSRPMTEFALDTLPSTEQGSRTPTEALHALVRNDPDIIARFVESWGRHVMFFNVLRKWGGRTDGGAASAG